MLLQVRCQGKEAIKRLSSGSWVSSQHHKTLFSHSFKVEEVLNGVEGMKMGDGEEEEDKQPRVTKAQKRRVKWTFPPQAHNLKQCNCSSSR